MIPSNYFKLVISFGTKGFIKNDVDRLAIKGKAYYIFDKATSKYIHEYIQVNQANFRITDNPMLSTSYYRTKNVRAFRDQYLDIWTKSDLKHLDNVNYQELSNEQIEKINAVFKIEKTTVRRLFSYLSGSNPAGAETNPDASQLRCLNFKYFYFNFANPLKEFKCSDKIKQVKILENLDQIPEFSLEEVLKNEMIINFKESFWKWNANLANQSKKKLIAILQSKLKEKNSSNNYHFNKNTETTFELSEEQELFICGLKNKTIEGWQKLMENKAKRLKIQLRSFFYKNICKFLKEGKIPSISTNLNFDLDIIQNAHIIPFARLVKLEEYKKAIDPYNCLRINADTHLLYDRKQRIYFDLEGNIKYKNNDEIYWENYLNIYDMPEATKEYLREQFKERTKKNH